MLRIVLRVVLVSAILTQAQVAASSRVLPRQATPTNLPPGWTSFGCFVDNPDTGRSLTGASFTNTSTMTVEACVDFCNNLSFVYAGLEFGQECYCDDVFEFVAESAVAGDCNQPCVGDATEICGAPDRLSVYTSNTPAVFPTLVPSAGQWVSLGCFSDSTTSRTLAAQVNPGSVTVEACTNACMVRGFTLAGLEFGDECWCGSQILNGGAFVGNSNGITGSNPPVRPAGMNGQFCELPCLDSPSELCGGPNRMNLYNFTGSTTPVVVPSVGPWLSLGCIVDSTTMRTLKTQVQPASGGVTVENCISACSSHGFTLAGVEFGQECWCDSQNPFTGVPAPTSVCDMLCAGNVLEICGGPNALDVYQLQVGAIIVADLASTTSIVGGVTMLVNTVTSSNVQTVEPQIVTGIQNIISSIGTLSSDAGSAVNSGRNPLTGTQASQAVNALISLDNAISSLSGTLTSQNVVAILKPGFAQPLVNVFVSLSKTLDQLTQLFANEVVPSLSTSVLSVQTDFDRATGNMVNTY